MNCPECGDPFPAKPGSITEPIDHECEPPLWGKDGPKEGQVIELPDVPGAHVRWTDGHWEMS